MPAVSLQRDAGKVKWAAIATTVFMLGLTRPAGAGVVALGDSLADEYQFPINVSAGGDRRLAKNFVELLATLRPNEFDFGGFSATSRGSPRNQGYEYNWAEDGSTTASLLAKGQHTGAAGQIAAGKADLALVEIGANDFRTIFLPGSNPQQIATNALTNTLTAVGTLLAANPNAHVAVANVPDVTLTPQVRLTLIQDPSLTPLAQQVSGLIAQYNANLAVQLNTLPGADRIAQVDLSGVFSNLVNGPPVTINGASLDTLNPGPALSNLFIDVVHPGTYGSSLIANAYIDAIDSRFGDNIAPLTQSEIIGVPEPTAFISILSVAPIVLLARKRRRTAG